MQCIANVQFRFVPRHELLSRRQPSALCPPWGLHGGHSALPNRFSIVRNDGVIERFPTGKTPGHVALQAGDGFLVEVGGGGGYWNPLERDPERVLADAHAGYVSVEAAQRDYGVVIHQQGRRYEIDFPATESLRKRGGMR